MNAILARKPAAKSAPTVNNDAEKLEAINKAAPEASTDDVVADWAAKHDKAIRAVAMDAAATVTLAGKAWGSVSALARLVAQDFGDKAGAAWLRLFGSGRAAGIPALKDVRASSVAQYVSSISGAFSRGHGAPTDGESVEKYRERVAKDGSGPTANKVKKAAGDLMKGIKGKEPFAKAMSKFLKRATKHRTKPEFWAYMEECVSAWEAEESVATDDGDDTED